MRLLFVSGLFFILLQFSACLHSDTADSDAIRQELEIAYKDMRNVKDESALTSHFYNADLRSSFAMLLTPVLFAGKEVEVKNFQVLSSPNSETAEIKYALVIRWDGNEKMSTIEMEAKKENGEWKFDAEKFFPSNTDQSSNEDLPENSSSGAVDAGANGFISGNIGYPSDTWVDESIHVYACDVSTKEIFKNGNLDYKTGDYEIELPPGTYYVFAGNTDDISDKSNGFYDKAVPCGLSVECNDRTLIPVEVIAGEKVKGIVTGDWFAQ